MTKQELIDHFLETVEFHAGSTGSSLIGRYVSKSTFDLVCPEGTIRVSPTYIKLLSMKRFFKEGPFYGRERISPEEYDKLKTAYEKLSA